MYSPDLFKETICKVGKRMYDKNLVVANDGNISWRISDNEVLISPSGVCKADMTPDMILKIDMNGNVIEGMGKPSSELMMHLKVYQILPERKAVIHAHPIFAGAYAVANLPLDKIIYPTAYSFLGIVPLAKYGTSTTIELVDSVGECIRDGAKAILLANHGVLTSAATLWDAYFLLERLESYATISYLANQLGGGRELTAEEKTRLTAKIARQKRSGGLY
jgi:L-fuculose-phosphate aldolase